MRNKYDQLGFRIMETLEKSKSVPLTAREIAQRLNETTYHGEVFDTVVYKTTAKCHELKDKGKLLLSDARGVNGQLTYMLPRRLMFPPPSNSTPANPVLKPEVAERVVTVEPKPEPAAPVRPYTVGAGDAIVRVIDEAARPLNKREVEKALEAKGIKSTSIGSLLKHAKDAGRIQSQKARRGRKVGAKLEYFTAKTGQVSPARATAPAPAKAPATREYVATVAPKEAVFRPGRAKPVERRQLNLEIPVDKHDRIVAAAKQFDVPIVQFCLEAIDFALEHAEGGE